MAKENKSDRRWKELFRNVNIKMEGTEKWIKSGSRRTEKIKSKDKIFIALKIRINIKIEDEVRWVEWLRSKIKANPSVENINYSEILNCNHLTQEKFLIKTLRDLNTKQIVRG